MKNPYIPLSGARHGAKRNMLQSKCLVDAGAVSWAMDQSLNTVVQSRCLAGCTATQRSSCKGLRVQPADSQAEDLHEEATPVEESTHG